MRLEGCSDCDVWSLASLLRLRFPKMLDDVACRFILRADRRRIEEMEKAERLVCESTVVVVVVVRKNEGNNKKESASQAEVEGHSPAFWDALGCSGASFCTPHFHSRVPA